VLALLPIQTFCWQKVTDAWEILLLLVVVPRIVHHGEMIALVFYLRIRLKALAVRPLKFGRSTEVAVAISVEKDEWIA